VAQLKLHIHPLTDEMIWILSALLTFSILAAIGVWWFHSHWQ